MTAPETCSGAGAHFCRIGLTRETDAATTSFKTIKLMDFLAS
jgi:hypothetical protein